jgi:hypothetical protein
MPTVDYDTDDWPRVGANGNCVVGLMARGVAAAQGASFASADRALSGTCSASGVVVSVRGNCDFRGVLLTQGRFKSSHGTSIIRGMVACGSSLDMKGTRDIAYNSDVLANLANPWTLTVNLVPNTWREIKP